jgi:endonuclease YncB( thermonuclease family)
MSFASRFITGLLGVALIVLFWPSWLPVGFPQAWWVSELTRPDPLPPGSQALFTKPAKPSPPAPVPAAAPNTARAPVAPPQEIVADSTAETPNPDTTPEVPKTKTADAAPTAAITVTNKKDEIAIRPPTKPTLYYHVVVRDGGTLESGDVVITLSGIHVRDADATCKDKKGRAWACGAQARTALTRLIRGRAISCAAPAAAAAKSLTARCNVGGIDLSMWMVTQGWAVPSEPKEAKLAEAAETAQKKKIGLWR